MMEELGPEMIIYDHNIQKGFRVDFIKTASKKYRALIDPLGPGDV